MVTGAKEYAVAVVGGDLLSQGMALAGIKRIYSPETQEEVERDVSSLLTMDDIGIVVISQSLARMVKDRKLAYAIENSLLPIFVSLPAYGERSYEEDALRKLILRAIGIDIAVAERK